MYSTGIFIHEESKISAAKNACIIQGLIKNNRCIFGRTCQSCWLWKENRLIQIYSSTEVHWEMCLFV